MVNTLFEEKDQAQIFLTETSIKLKSMFPSQHPTQCSGTVIKKCQQYAAKKVLKTGEMSNFKKGKYKLMKNCFNPLIHIL